MNTTARLEALCRTLDAPILISGDLLARLPQLPENVASADLGVHAVRGRDQPLSVSSLVRRKVDAHQLAYPPRRGWRLPPILARKMATSCSEPDSLSACGPGVERIAEEVAERFPNVYCSVGTHPHHADEGARDG